MTTITVDEAKQSFERFVEEVLAGSEAIIVSNAAGQQVVLLSLVEFNSWKETLYLLSTGANSEHLRKSVSQARAGEIHEKELVDA